MKGELPNIYYKTTEEILEQEAKCRRDKESGTYRKERDECPLPLSVIPNYLGINLCSVRGVEWLVQEDGQLISIDILFIPA